MIFHKTDENESHFKIFSDESPLLKNQMIFPFPLRIALREEVLKALTVILPPSFETRSFKRKNYSEKRTFSFPKSSVASPMKLEHIIFGKITPGAKPRIVSKGRASTFLGLMHSLVIGIGLTQMKEHMLGIEAIPRLIRTFFSRFVECIKLSAKSSYEFTLSENPKVNLEVLLHFLEEAKSNSVTSFDNEGLERE
jgi:hypothetical protein